VTLDLNGINITGKITVKDGATLYGCDYATYDYDISDGVYGKITTIKGNSAPAPYTEDRDVSLPVTEDDGTSFHAVGLNISSMALNTASAGLYYINNFDGDSFVKEQIASYGVALSLTEEPTAENMGDTSLFTQFDGSTFGSGDATSSLVYGIMKPQNGATMNSHYAAMPIHGRAYAKLTSGEYLFGVTRTRSLRQQLELADKYYFGLYETSLKEFYTSYQKTLVTWDVPNLLASVK